MGSHSVTWHSAAVNFPPLPQSELVLDLATPEGGKAELTCLMVHHKIVYPVNYIRNNKAVSWRGSNQRRKSHKSNILTITPPNYSPSCGEGVSVGGRGLGSGLCPSQKISDFIFSRNGVLWCMLRSILFGYWDCRVPALLCFSLQIQFYLDT